MHERYFSAGPIFPAMLNMSERERHLAAFVGMFRGKRVEGVAPFNSVHESYRVINKVSRESGIGQKIFGELFIALSDARNAGPLLPYDGTPATFVNTQIVADTAGNGGFSANRVYELQREQYYLANAILTVPNGQTLRFRASAGAGRKPILFLWETGTGGTPTRPPGNFVVLNGGNLEIKNIGVAGFYEPEPNRLDGVQGGLINTTAVGSSIVLDGVIMSNINGQHVRTGFNTVKVKVVNSIFANMGALTTSNLGAGKGIDLREAACDTFIVQNTTFVNFQDRAIRHYNFANPGAGTGEIKYGLIDHNTFVNGMGFHGLLSLGNVGPEIIITNNLFVDAFALGEDSTDATRAAEWANTGEVYPNGRNRITWIFTSPNTTTQWKVDNNFYTITPAGQQFLTDFNYPAGSPLSYHINSRLGADSVNAFTQTTLALTNAPRLMTNMLRWYESPTGGNRLKNTPCACFNVAIDDFDRRTIEFYRDSLDATYSTSNAAYTGAENGYPAGDLNWYPALKARWEQGLPAGVESRSNTMVAGYHLAQNYPNPFNPSTSIAFSLVRAGNVKLEIYNALGQNVATLVNGKMPAGQHSVIWDARNVPSGLYFYKLEAGAFSQMRKMVLMK